MNHNFHMIDVGAKPSTRRIAIAEGCIHVGSAVFEHLRARTLPKGDALLLAEVAGIQGAKLASQTIPLCHPLGLDHVQIKTELDASRHTVKVFCIAATRASTGVEMEALAGVNAALLTIWDLSKMIDPDLRIEGIRLLAKSGGKSGLWLNPAGVPDWAWADYLPKAKAMLTGISAAVITLSDRAAKGLYEDTSGPLAQTLLEAAGAKVIDTSVLPDEPAILRDKILQLCQQGAVRLIVTSGGTGIAPRDKTPETVAALADRIVPGIGELLRQYGAQFTPQSWSSRSLGAILGKVFIVTLPGSPKAVREGMECLIPRLQHLINTLDDIKHDEL